MLNDNLIVKKVKQEEKALLLNDKKETSLAVCAYEVAIGDDQFNPGDIVLLDEHDLRHWNDTDKVIKKDQLIMKFDKEVA